jgi:hypothetical protein
MTRRGGTTVFVGIAGGGKFVLPTLQLAMEDRMHWGHVPDDELRLMTHANAAKLFRHSLPDVTQP